MPPFKEDAFLKSIVRIWMTPWLISSEHREEHFKLQSKNPQRRSQRNNASITEGKLSILMWSHFIGRKGAPSAFRPFVRDQYIHTLLYCRSKTFSLSAPRAQIEWERRAVLFCGERKKKTSERYYLSRKIPGAADSEAFKVNLQLILHCCVENTSIFCLPLFSHSLRLCVGLGRELLRVSGLNSCTSSRFISVC